MQYQGKLLEKFSHQIQFAFENYQFEDYKQKDFNAVVIAGLGGSGIAGQIIKNFFAPYLDIGIEVLSSYNIPAYVNEKTLFIGSSYSGNTEETLYMCQQARKKNAKIIVLTTGNKLLDFAQKHHYPYCLIEKGYQPRMALGYSLTYLLIFFSRFCNREGIKDKLYSNINALKKIDDYQKQAKNYIKTMALKDNKQPIIIFSDEHWFPSGLRFAQQLQENAKLLCFNYQIPEGMHNVLESLYGNVKATFFLIYDTKNKRIALNFQYLKAILKKNKQVYIEIEKKETDILEVYKQIYIFDWLSLMLADNFAIKSDDIFNIWGLKKMLKEN